MKFPTKKMFHNFSYKTNLIVAFILVLMPVFVVTSIFVYTNSKNRAEADFEQSKIRCEYEITSTIKLVDEGWKIFEKSLEKNMIEAFEVFEAAYNASGSNPAEMNLTALRSEIGLKYDLYIINASGVIIATTYKTDLYLDFSNLNTFFSILTEIRQGDQFVSDRITTETLTGTLRKFAYLPTPDHQYLLELGLVSDEFSSTIDELNYLNIAEKLIPLDPYLENIRIFDRLAYQEGLSDFQPSPELFDIVRSVYETGIKYEFKNETTGQLIKYIFIDLSDPNYPTNISKIVEITYNNNLIEEELLELRIQFIFANLLIVSVILIIVIVITKIFTAPINEIVQGVNEIAKGDLNYVIATKTQTDLQSIVESINLMVRERKRIDDELLQEGINLKKSLEDKEILLKEIHHRVKNNLQIISSLARLQKNSDISTDIIQANKDFQNRIQIMAMIHEILYGSNDMEFINLDQYVTQLVDFLFRSFQISKSEILVEIEIGEIQLNLDQGVLCGIIINEIITNALKYAFPKKSLSNTIHINIQEQNNGTITMIFSDNGVGLPLDFDHVTSKTLGMQLIYGLSKQLGGSISVFRDSGLRYEISFKKI
ncbi:histidine kinase dimerization/phosphoacceptor domain -containing protein [Candidatus Lokiarchaeum ossiferum]|uniref:histidine kinase dimerization/phosphoacceptor domain -containing protein n=1 Tax=Candidatus Lokiarchaeum ossiferum TaxID=2951803 RepID=UPI00352BEB97